MKDILSKILKAIYRRMQNFLIPSHLKKNQIKLDISKIKIIEKSIEDNFHQGWRSKKYSSDELYGKDLNAHLLERLETDRKRYIPWFDKVLPLKGSNILEIGCGTGSSTVALAEQDAKVTAIDFDKDALKVALDRCKVYNLDVKLLYGNACDLYNSLKSQEFDLVIFFACIEHMTFEERLECLEKYYSLLKEGSYLSIIGTPNRLWYFDYHTSMMPFFNWLPDRLAFDYSKNSSRTNFNELYHTFSKEKIEHFLRRGRGFSFHELELALSIPAEELNVIDYLDRSFLLTSSDRKYHRLLKKIKPKINPGFFFKNIDIIIKK